MTGLILNDMKRMLNFGIHADLQVYRLLLYTSQFAVRRYLRLDRFTAHTRRLIYRRFQNNFAVLKIGRSHAWRFRYPATVRGLKDVKDVAGDADDGMHRLPKQREHRRVLSFQNAIRCASVSGASPNYLNTQSNGKRHRIAMQT